ncbi:hypothetical protein CEXT_551371 [Caerostris extrusa]|uniref:Uncharacterized protein n=1 Tax=Caerostris extrusa TaxID=172846 RepID=A0AAV4UNX7_CAEEX|nr:hypothetical protein CEXT_551371 [Caerostris extrusa]
MSRENSQAKIEARNRDLWVTKYYPLLGIPGQFLSFLEDMERIRFSGGIEGNVRTPCIDSGVERGMRAGEEDL